MQSLTTRCRSLAYSLMPLIPALAAIAVIVALLSAGSAAAGVSPRQRAVPSALPPHGGSSEAARPARRSAAATGGVLAGTTSQQWPAMFELSGDGRQIKRALFAVSMNCDDGEEIALPDPWLAVPVKSNGSFKVDFQDSFSDQGATVALSDSLSGKFNRKRSRVSATLHLQMTVSEPDGSSLTCDSGSVKVHGKD